MAILIFFEQQTKSMNENVMTSHKGIIDGKWMALKGFYGDTDYGQKGNEKRLLLVDNYKGFSM